MSQQDLELKKYEYKIYATINDLSDDIKDRFKAIGYVSDKIAELSGQFENEAKKIEYEAKQIDKPLYKLRAMIIQGKDIDSSDITTSEFDRRLNEINDEVYDSIKIKEFKNIAALSH